ncbi:MAG TPA: rhodanese-like domain-containing protein, partial [Terriglobales bacterium]|nr:rhodanese-like domain-containing protein [Terriglobales bacterium]
MDFEITPEELKHKLDAGADLTVLDVREPWEFDAAHIHGSKLIPMDQIPGRVNQELDPEDHIVVICHHGIRSANVAAWLLQQGFERVQSLRGGIDRWSRTIDPKVPLY